MNALAQSTRQNKNASISSAPSLLVQRKCACGGVSKLGGQCSKCEKKKLVGGNVPSIQPKLKIGQPNDKYEQEADRVADEVMRMSEPQFDSTATVMNPLQIQRVCTECGDGLQRQTINEEEKEFIQAKEALGQRPVMPSGIQSRIEGLRSGGHPLSSSASNFFQSRFGHDFSQVRIHSGARAAEIARTIRARAFTIGNDIVFGAKEYAPATIQGKKLLAHELTHVIQQSGNAAPSVIRRAPAQSGPVCKDTEEITGAGKVTQIGPTHWSLWNFDVDEHSLKGQHITSLVNDIGPVLLKTVTDPRTIGALLVSGTASATASTRHNIPLSRRRASCVASVLVSLGIPRDRIVGPVGFGDVSAEMRLAAQQSRGETVTKADREKDENRQVTVRLVSARVPVPEGDGKEPADCRKTESTRYVAWLVRGAVSITDIFKRLPKSFRKRIKGIGKKIKKWLGPLGDLVPWEKIIPSVGLGTIFIGTRLTPAEKKAGGKEVMRGFAFETGKFGSDSTVDSAKTTKPVTLTSPRKLSDLDSSTFTLTLKSGSNDQTLNIKGFGALDMKGVVCNESGGTIGALLQPLFDTQCRELPLPWLDYLSCDKEEEEEEEEPCPPWKKLLPSKNFRFQIGRMSAKEIASNSRLQTMRRSMNCSVAAAHVRVEAQLIDGTWLWRPFYWLQSVPNCRFNVEQSDQRITSPSFTNMSGVWPGAGFPESTLLSGSGWRLLSDSYEMNLKLPGRWDVCSGGQISPLGMLIPADSIDCGRAKAPRHTGFTPGTCDAVADKLGPSKAPLLWYQARDVVDIGQPYVQLLSKPITALRKHKVELAVFGGRNWAGQLVLTVALVKVIAVRKRKGEAVVRFLSTPCSVNRFGQAVLSTREPGLDCAEPLSEGSTAVLRSPPTAPIKQDGAT